MRPYISDIPKGSVKVSNLPDWALSHGVVSLTAEEISHLCGINQAHISQFIKRLRDAHKIFSPTRGLWVPVSPEYRTWGAPSPAVYIHDFMNFANTDYAIGWLTAAAAHGASHQAAQVFQVATSRHLRNRREGRSMLEFYKRDYVDKITLAKRGPDSTAVKIASVGATMLMVASDLEICGGINNVATLIVELAEENPNFSDSLAQNVNHFSAASCRRIGWILDTFGDGAPSELFDYCNSLTEEKSILVRYRNRKGANDSRWNLFINDEVDPDL